MPESTTKVHPLTYYYLVSYFVVLVEGVIYFLFNFSVPLQYAAYCQLWENLVFKVFAVQKV